MYISSLKWFSGPNDAASLVRLWHHVGASPLVRFRRSIAQTASTLPALCRICIYESPIQALRFRHAVQHGSLTKQTGQLPLEGGSFIWEMSRVQCESANVFAMVLEHGRESLGSCNMHFVIKPRILRMMHICLVVISQGPAEND